MRSDATAGGHRRMTVGGQGEADATRSFRDGPCARGLAVLCFLLAITALGYLHREALIPGLAQEEAADDPVIDCIQARTVEVKRMQRDGLITGQQAATFRSEEGRGGQEGGGTGSTRRTKGREETKSTTHTA